MFQFRSAVYTSERFPRSLLSLFSFRWMCQLSRMHCVVVYGLLSSTSSLTEVHIMACSESMFCQCRSSHVTISESTPMLLQPVLQGSPSLPNVHLWAFCAVNRADHSLSLIYWHSVLRVEEESDGRLAFLDVQLSRSEAKITSSQILVIMMTRAASHNIPQQWDALHHKNTSLVCKDIPVCIRSL